MMLHAISMILTMVVIQVFVMPYMMVDTVADVYLSASQAYMGAAMGAAMVAVDSVLWHPMPLWGWILTLAIGVGAVWGFRSQLGIGDREYLRDMIPHHSMAILTSRHRLQSRDGRVVRLAEGIMDTQVREIEQMRAMLNAPTQ